MQRGKKKVNEHELDKAEQQILGFYRCYQGGSIRSLLDAMGLTFHEYISMIRKGMLDYLPGELVDEIDEYFEEQSL